MATPTPTTPDIPSGTAMTGTPTCTTAIPGQHGQVPFDACNSYWAFHPSFGANLAWAVLMGLTTAVHLFQAVIYKKKFCWVLLMGASWETASFALRAAGSRDEQQEAYAIVSQILLLLAPLWLNAFVYMTVSRLIYYVHEDQKVLRCRAIILTRVFVWLDVLCFLVQAAGGLMLSADDDKILKIGMDIYIGGIAFQQAVIAVFFVLTAQFYRELGVKGRADRPVRLTKWLLVVLLVNFALITIRIIFRLVEFIPGTNADNPLLTNEVYVFCLDALPVLLGLILLNVIHPGLVLRGPESEFPRVSRAEKKRLKAEKKEEKRGRKAAKKEAKTQRRIERKVERDGWVEVGMEELQSTNESRHDRPGDERV